MNAACDNALVTAYARGKRTIGWREIGEAMRDLRRQMTWASSRFSRPATLLAAAAIGGGLALGALALARDGWAPLAMRVGLMPPLATATAVPSSTPTEIAPTATSEPTPEPVETPPAPALVPDGSSPSVAGTADGAASTSGPSEMAVPEVTPASAATTAPVAPFESPHPDGSHARPGNVDPTGAIRIRVSVGDTLTDLAVRYYGNASPRVMALLKAANPWLDDPNLLLTGLLTLPAPRLPEANSTSEE